MNFGTNGGRDQKDHEPMNIAKSSNNFSSSSNSSPQYKSFFPFSNNARNSNTEEAPNFTQISHHHHGEEAADESSTNTDLKEHMFDKVVTPSDVGKLNRLVIPKQYAEKYFPLDASNNENNKGLLLNFEDAHGKPWRFRYSYWNSSQSYVMTKGWSRFVKDKKLDAGDIVSFFRGVGELCKDRLYIDWRRRVVNYSTVPLISRRDFPQNYTWNSRDFVENRVLQQHQNSGAAGGWSPLFLLPPPQPMMQLPRQQFNNNNNNVSFYPNYDDVRNNTYHQYNNGRGACNSPGSSIIYLRSTAGLTRAHHEDGGGSGGGRSEQMILDSVPVVHQGKVEGKKMRLFGVNMECASESSCDFESNNDAAMPTSTSQSRLYNGIPIQIDFLNQGKPSSPMSLDLDI